MNKFALWFGAALLAPLLLLWGCGEPTGGDRSVNVQEEIQRLSNPQTRIDAIVELAKAGPRAESAVPALIPLLKEPDIDTRRLSAYALGEIGPAAKPAMPELARLQSSDPDFYVRSAANNAMQAIDLEATAAPSGGNLPVPGQR